jgi:hypothetical protein
MQNLAKRQWRPSLSIKESADIMIEWCIKARDKNVLRKKPPQIFYAYVVEDMIPLQYMYNISVAFKYSQKDVPYLDSAKDILLRELSVALKAHFFLFQDSKIAHEPYFFTMPSFGEAGATIFGLLYHIEKENKTIVVCEKNISSLFEKSNILLEFPAVVIEDSFKWYHMKNWSKIKIANGLEGKLESNTSLKKKINEAKELSTREELEKLGSILDVPYEIKELIKPLGIEWNNKVKCWFLPKGFDIDSVIDYIAYVKREFIENEIKIKS